MRSDWAPSARDNERCRAGYNIIYKVYIFICTWCDKENLASRCFTLVAKNATPINIANALPRLVDAVAVLAPRVGRAHGAQLAFPTESAAEKDETKNDHQKTFNRHAMRHLAAAAYYTAAARTSKIVGNALPVGIFFLCHRHFSIERDRIGFNSPEHWRACGRNLCENQKSADGGNWAPDNRDAMHVLRKKMSWENANESMGFCCINFYIVENEIWNWIWWFDHTNQKEFFVDKIILIDLTRSEKYLCVSLIY